jgi:hypothetical protein
VLRLAENHVFLAVAVFTMRTYAMWSMNKLVLTVLGALAITCVVLDCVSAQYRFCEQHTNLFLSLTATRARLEMLWVFD